MIQTQHQAANVYNDIGALQGINKLGKEDKNAALMQVAKQFESMFLKMMLSSMRDANKVFKEDSLFSSSESDFYEKMYDDQITLSLSTSQSTGLAEVIHRQMLSNYGMASDKPSLDHSGLRRHNSSLQDAIQKVEKSLISRKESSEGENLSEENPAVAKQSIAANGDGNKGQQFASVDEFVAAIYPFAQKIAKELQVDAKAIVAQAALETGWGKHMITDKQGRNSYNFFGIKADQRWQGSKVEVTTHEYRAGTSVKEKALFRSYGSMEEGLRDYAKFLASSERYSNALGNNLTGKEYGHALQKAGYATDPAYGKKIDRISSGDTLNQALQQLMPVGGRKDG